MEGNIDKRASMGSAGSTNRLRLGNLHDTHVPSNMKEILQYDQRQRFVIIVASRLHMGHRDLIRIFMQLANKQKETQRWISQEDIYHNRYNQTIEICPIDHFTSSAQIGPAVFIVCAAYSKCGDRGQ